ncbi:Crp/Fnr family transcriptional regulator [Pedobacter sp. L105]|uniref:Crp/Fnr family transcriptional regulator n=1 Tax=Pedobacter sp. L105 TaxID=1641871 RepID=UPI00131BFE15|nr:cyclic nucleotide-binding domain-containing protein [Pedobacter sp. L105]
MIKQNLTDYLLDLDPMPEELKNGMIRSELIQYVNSRISTSHHNHRVLILTAGMIPDRIYFIVKGVVRGYKTDEKGKEKTTFLWDDHSIMTDVNSFIHRTPTDIYLEVMPNSTLNSISYQQLIDIFERFPFINRFMSKLVVYSNKYSHKSFYNYAKPSAWERYQELLDRYPYVEQKVSKEIIASFLEVTPQYLSKMIKENR